MVYSLFLNVDKSQAENGGPSIVALFYSFPDIIIVSILAISAFRMAKFVRKATGKRPNVWLVILHILNVLLYSTFVVAYAVLDIKYQSLSDQQDSCVILEKKKL